MSTTGVFPCYKNQFKVREPGTETAYPIADIENFGVSFDDGVEEWKPYDQEGWTRCLKTAKKINIAVSGKRNVGDKGNNLVASKAFANGKDAELDFIWTFPDGTEVIFPNSPINIKELGTGDSTNVGPLAFEALSNGKPTVKLPTEQSTPEQTTSTGT